MKRIAADVWIPDGWTKKDRQAKTRDDIRGLEMAEVLEQLAAETKAWTERVRHETSGR